jgi:hypothetical protein
MTMIGGVYGDVTAAPPDGVAARPTADTMVA